MYHKTSCVHLKTANGEVNRSAHPLVIVDAIAFKPRTSRPPHRLRDRLNPDFGHRKSTNAALFQSFGSGWHRANRGDIVLVMRRKHASHSCFVACKWCQSLTTCKMIAFGLSFAGLLVLCFDQMLLSIEYHMILLLEDPSRLGILVVWTLRPRGRLSRRLPMRQYRLRYLLQIL